jgi:RNA polymerase sigma-70 factor (ECF subfamily)
VKVPITALRVSTQALPEARTEELFSPTTAAAPAYTLLAVPERSSGACPFGGRRAIIAEIPVLRCVAFPQESWSVDDLSREKAAADRPARDEAPSQDGGPLDWELVRQAHAGSTAAFKVLVDRHSKKAYWTAYNIVRSHEDSQDIAQEAFIRVYRFLDRYDPNQRFTTWLYQIVVNLSIDALRRRKGVPPARLDNVPEAASGQPGPYQHVERRERQEKVREVLETLPPPYRVILTLRDIEGLPSQEVARILAMNHATVRWRLHRARALFKETWETRYGTDTEVG